VPPGNETSTHFSSCSCGIGAFLIKNASGDVTLNLCFASRRICGSRCALHCFWGAKRRRTIFLARVGPLQIPEKTHRDTLHQILFFHPGGDAGHIVHSSASGVRNIDTIFFLLGWELYGCQKKCGGTHDAELVFLHPVGSAGHIVHSGASWM
jgi:hypothetical protein